MLRTGICVVECVASRGVGARGHIVHRRPAAVDEAGRCVQVVEVDRAGVGLRQLVEVDRAGVPLAPGPFATVAPAPLPPLRPPPPPVAAPSPADDHEAVSPP